MTVSASSETAAFDYGMLEHLAFLFRFKRNSYAHNQTGEENHIAVLRKLVSKLSLIGE